MDGYGYFVEGGDVLPNKLGVDDAAELQKTEYDITSRKTAEVLLLLQPRVFDFDCLLGLHKILFGNIYDFAGQVRKVNISKPDSPVPFCYADFILPEAERIFGELARDNYLVDLDREDFVKKLAYYASELNALHPFREGNGRTNRLFLDLLATNAGYLIDFDLVMHEEILFADEAAFAGNLEPLEGLYRKITCKI